MYYIFVLAVFVAAVSGGYSGSSSTAGNEVDNSGQQNIPATPVDAVASPMQPPSQHQPPQGSGPPAGFPPNYPGFLDFNNFLAAYFDYLRRYHEQFASKPYSYAFTSNDPNSNAKAESSLIIDSNYKRNQYPSNSIAQQHMGGFGPAGPAGFTPFGFPNYGGGFGGSFAGFYPQGPGQVGAGVGNGGGNRGGNGAGSGAGSGVGALAGASVGPQGAYHTAAVFPENPGQQNVYNRFSETGGQPNPNGNNFYGVFTSSSSSSSTDADGKTMEKHEAQTTVNDNGKVTTYKVKNP